MPLSERALNKKGSLDKSQEDEGHANKIADDQEKNAKPEREEEKEEQPANPTEGRMRKAARRIGRFVAQEVFRTALREFWEAIKSEIVQ